MKYSSRTIGFLQATGLAVYVGLFAFTASRFTDWIHIHEISPEPVIGITVFLLAFIISATTCVSIMFGYPIFVFSENHKYEAITIVLWSVGWLLLIFLGLVAGVMFF